MRLKKFKTKYFDDEKKAVAYIEEIYSNHINYLRYKFEEFNKGNYKKSERITAFYPYIRVSTQKARRSDTRFSYGFAPRAGTYSTTVTRLDIFKKYYEEQIKLLLKNHNQPIEIGVSNTAIPVHFALGEDYYLEADLSSKQIEDLQNIFEQPDLSLIDDQIANGYFVAGDDEDQPLSLFTAPRADISLQRLKHYTATNSKHFQNYVIYTNYQFYIDEFIRICHELMAPSGEDNEYTAFVEPGNKITTNSNYKDNPEKDSDGFVLKRMPQMPAYHLKRADGSGITMINIGVGPSNAKNITDHVAVLRPHAWLMLGHCAGLRNSQRLGDYVLAHGYYREDQILDKDLNPKIPIPALSEIQLALEQAVSEITGMQGYDLKKVMRTGTVATVDDRNWELRASISQNRNLSQSRAIALDMESGTIAANGFRFRVPYGTLLCVSDKPLHGQVKLPGMAESFYRQRVEQHLQIGLRTMSLLREIGAEKLHSRKLRSFNEVAFQ